MALCHQATNHYLGNVDQDLWRHVTLLGENWYKSGLEGNLPHMMTSSNGNIFRVTDPLCGEFTGPVEFPIQRPVTRSFDVFFDLRPKKRLSKQPWGWWFETLSWSLWRQCNEMSWWPFLSLEVHPSSPHVDHGQIMVSEIIQKTPGGYEVNDLPSRASTVNTTRIQQKHVLL